GGGKDTFLLGGVGGSWGVKTITDLQANFDHFELKHVGFGLSSTGNLGAAGVGFINGSTPNVAGPQLLYDKISGNLNWDSDGTGPAGAVQLAQVPSLTPTHAIPRCDTALRRAYH